MGQASHVFPFWTHISLSLHWIAAQEGFSPSGHSTQRLKMDLMTFSTSLRVMAAMMSSQQRATVVAVVGPQPGVKSTQQRGGAGRTASQRL
jgi:hypothetical protein